MRSLWEEIFRYRVNVITLVLSVALLCQFANILTYIAANVDSQSIIAATDDDASSGIAKVVKTRWWSDNGWAHYGRFYFRTAHSLQYFWGMTAAPSGAQAHEVWERTAHFSIMLISLLSVYGYCYLLSTVLTSSRPHRLASTVLFVALGLSNSTWIEFVLRAHPDHLFALVCGLAFYVSARWLTSINDERLFVGSALLWGIAAATKLSIVLMIPAFLLLFSLL
ncbi:MAG: hypothetical protein KDD70_05610 [Bdellovibrionales bacterium]|nr:hypothetical protein [Bdellovibrionales bacterium]